MILAGHSFTAIASNFPLIFIQKRERVFISLKYSKFKYHHNDELKASISGQMPGLHQTNLTNVGQQYTEKCHTQYNDINLFLS